MKKVYPQSLVAWFYGIALFSAFTAFIIFMIWLLCQGGSATAVLMGCIFLSMYSMVDVFVVVICGIYLFRWAVVDEEGVRGYCLFGKTKSLKWEELDRVKVMGLDFTVTRDFGLIFIFVRKDEEEEKTYAVLTKNIVYKHSKRRAEFLKKVYPEINIDYVGIEFL